MIRNLFHDSDDNLNECNFEITTNENYARTYNSLRKKELLQKFKDTELDISESDESDSSEEDEILDPSFDQYFLKTLASLKSKDPTIYDKNTKFFKCADSDDSSNGNVQSSINKEKKSKPVTLKDYERKIILETGGKFVDDSDIDDDDERKAIHRPISPTIAEEERNLKIEFKNVLNKDDSADEEFGGIFKKREKTKVEEDKEEEDYLKWLAGKKENIGKEVQEKLKPLKNYWSNEELPPSEKFLRDYVLNKGYSDANNYDEIPTYEEIVGDQALSEDEQELEKQAEFEQKYNFRYEDPDQEFIKRYPRTIETSLRSTDEKRKKKRQEIKERKLQEKQQKVKELEMVKEMKRKEIEEKIEKLKMITGNDELGFNDADLEEDFDPEAHDRRMQEIFNEDYYQVDEGEEKPECPSDIHELKVEDWDNYDPQHDFESYDYDENEPHCEDEDFNMDCEYDHSKAKVELQRELVANTRKNRTGRKGRRDRFMEIIKSEKPVFDPEDEKTYGEYIDEYYKLDCEDIIDDIPCRFKYVETAPNDFGLSIDEILLAKNKELNQWASLKKTIQIKTDHAEKKEQRLYKLKAKNEELKRKIFKSLYGEGSDNENEDLQTDQAKEQTVSQNTETKSVCANTLQEVSKKSKKRRKRKSHNAQESLHSLNERTDFSTKNNGITEGIPTKKGKIEEDNQINIPTDATIGTETNADVGKKKKKRKNKVKSQTHMENLTTNGNNQKNPFSNGLLKKQIYNDEKINNKSKETNSTNQDTKVISKKNPFTKVFPQFNNSTESGSSLPPLRKNLPKAKILHDISKVKFKSKINTQKAIGSNAISDERLKAYGINPKKFHKKQKYGNVN